MPAITREHVLRYLAGTLSDELAGEIEVARRNDPRVAGWFQEMYAAIQIASQLPDSSDHESAETLASQALSPGAAAVLGELVAQAGKSVQHATLCRTDGRQVQPPEVQLGKDTPLAGGRTGGNGQSPSRSQDAADCAGAPRVGSGKKAKSVPALALALSVVLIAPVSAGAGWYLSAIQARKQLKEAWERLELNDPVEFVSGRINRPLAVVDKRLVKVKGLVKPGIVREIRVTVTPGKDPGGPPWEESRHFREDNDLPKPFDIPFDLPEDTLLRRFEIKLVPHEDLQGLTSRNLLPDIEPVFVECGPDVVKAYVSPDRAAEVVNYQWEQKRLLVDVRVHSRPGTFVTVSTGKPGQPRLAVEPPQQVAPGQNMITFELFPGEDSGLVVVPYTAESVDALQPESIRQGQLDGILIGKETDIAVQ